jgi:hypothetical protein
MKKPNKKEHLNLLLSAFLILAFIVCANFFAGFTSSMPTMTAQLINIAVYAVFGLLLFYATRVGDGKAVFRFSPLTLLILVLPSVFIIVASLAAFMPLHDVVAADALTGKLSVITSLAAVAVGYGIPYSFVSGFELEGYKADDEEETVVNGGVQADLADSDIAAAEEAEEAGLQNLDVDGE